MSGSRWSAWSLLGSIRFRLTAWYTILLAGILIAIGVPLAALFEEQLATDRDRRLESTARQIAADLQTRVSYVAYIYPLDGLRLVDAFGRQVELDNYTLPGLFIQVYFNIANASDKSSNLGPYDLPAVAADDDDMILNDVEITDTSVRTVQLTLRVNTLPDGALLVVGETLEPFQATVRELHRLLAVASVAGIALAAGGGWLLAGQALRPVDQVTAAAALIAAAERTAASLGTRLDVPATGDEVARLAATFNAMLDRLQAAFETQRRFLADASHELRTPLTAIRGNVEVVLRQVAGRPSGEALPPEILDALEDVRRESDRMGRLLGDLLLLARSDAPSGAEMIRRQPVRLDLLAQDVVRSARGLAAGQYLEVFAAGPIEIEGDPDRLRQLLLALLDNAIRHTPARGQVIVDVEMEPPDVAILRVRDTGEGIAPEHLPHLFERFYRADGARARATGGTGLGLAIARAITEAHAGTIAISSEPGKGTEVTIRLPGASVPPDAPAPYRPDLITIQPIAPTTITTPSGRATPRNDSRSNPSP